MLANLITGHHYIIYICRLFEGHDLWTAAFALECFPLDQATSWSEESAVQSTDTEFS